MHLVVALIFTAPLVQNGNQIDDDVAVIEQPAQRFRIVHVRGNDLGGRQHTEIGVRAHVACRNAQRVAAAGQARAQVPAEETRSAGNADS